MSTSPPGSTTSTTGFIGRGEASPPDSPPPSSTAGTAGAPRRRRRRRCCRRSSAVRRSSRSRAACELRQQHQGNLGMHRGAWARAGRASRRARSRARPHREQSAHRGACFRKRATHLLPSAHEVEASQQSNSGAYERNCAYQRHPEGRLEAAAGVGRHDERRRARRRSVRSAVRGRGPFPVAGRHAADAVRRRRLRPAAQLLCAARPARSQRRSRVAALCRGGAACGPRREARRPALHLRRAITARGALHRARRGAQN